MRWLLLTCLLLGAILATKSEINEEEKTLTINGFESKEQIIENRIEEGGLKVQNIAENENSVKKKAGKKKKGNKKPLKPKRPNLHDNKPKKQKKQRNKKTKIQKHKHKQKTKRPKHKKKKEKKGKKVRNKNGKGKRKGTAKNKDKGKQKKKKHKNDKKKRRKQIQKKIKGKERNIKNTKQKAEKIEKIKRKERKEKAKKRKIKKKFKKKKDKKKKIKNTKKSGGKKFIKQATEVSCEEIILSRIKLERKAVNYMRQFNRSKRFMGKTDNKFKKQNIWLKDNNKKQDPISLLIKCGGNDENNLKCAGSTSNKNSVMMTTLLANLRNCTPNIGSQCDEGKFPAKDSAFDQCAAHLMAYQAKSQECLKKDGAGACTCYSTTDAKDLYDKGKACNAPLMQKYERSVLKTKDNCVSKFKDCRKYQDELAVVMMTCCGDGGECPAQ